MALKKVPTPFTRLNRLHQLVGTRIVFHLVLGASKSHTLPNVPFTFHLMPFYPAQDISLFKPHPPLPFYILPLPTLLNPTHPVYTA